MSERYESIKHFAKLINSNLKSDRDVILACGGMTGSGKSTFTSQLMMAYGRRSGVGWSFDNMTYSRTELMTWIDGDKETEPDSNGLRKGQLPEYSGILADEFFSMFYKRNWYDADQIDAISTFNMCRDRHLFLAGNIPSWDDLDSGFKKRIRYYVYIPDRGTAWVFKQDNNPFSSDPWNTNINFKRYMYSGRVSRLSNYLFTVKFGDWEGDLKDKYYKIRNEKRLKALSSDQKVDKKDVHRKKLNDFELLIGKVIYDHRKRNKWDDIRKSVLLKHLSLGQVKRLYNKYLESIE